MAALVFLQISLQADPSCVGKTAIFGRGRSNLSFEFHLIGNELWLKKTGGSLLGREDRSLLRREDSSIRQL
ncbi:MAG: hypothetical protein EOO06_08925 [Chitinophagaceae bacterium]|nr:MAG: hypothetical protein EOO06_08925 [Chitinophagaceae bacterium]